MMLKPYDEDAKCPKCGSEMQTRYSSGCQYNTYSYLEGPWPKCHQAGEHLDRICARCGYAWAELCEDAEEYCVAREEAT